MRLPNPAAAALRLPRRTLRAQLALLYTAVFCTSAAALAAVAVIFKPNFLVESSCQAAPHTPSHLEPCSRYATHLSFAGTISHDAKQNLAGMAMVAPFTGPPRSLPPRPAPSRGSCSARRLPGSRPGTSH